MRSRVRLLNAFRRWRAGLPARGRVSPEVPNDTYQALLALYAFASRFAAGRRVLDLRCGTGYGSVPLREASEVVGLDPDERNLAYARERSVLPPHVSGRGISGSRRSLPTGPPRREP